MTDVGTFDLMKGHCDRCDSLSELDEMPNGDLVCPDCSGKEEKEVADTFREASKLEELMME